MAKISKAKAYAAAEKAESKSEKKKELAPPPLMRDIAEYDKIAAALPQVKGLGDLGDQELDELAQKAKDAYEDIMDLGMNVEARYSGRLFEVAASMLGHAIQAKTAKLDKKLKMIDLQMKKMRLDQQQQALDAKDPESAATQTAHGVVLSRNDLLERIIGKGQNTQKE